MTQRMRLVPDAVIGWQIRKVGGEWEVLHVYDNPMDEIAMEAHQEEQRPLYAASPNGGLVTDADLERAAIAIWRQGCDVNAGDWDELPANIKDFCRADVRAACAALGLVLASEPTRSEGEG